MNPLTPDPGERESDRHDDQAVLEELILANVNSNATMVDLVERVRQDAVMQGTKVDLLEKGQRQTRRLLVMVSVALLLMVIIGVINAVNIGQTRRNAEITAKTAKDAGDTYALLLDCLNSRGECGKRNAEASKATLDEVKKYELTVLYCVRINPQVEDAAGRKFLDCVNRLYPGGPQLNSLK